MTDQRMRVAAIIGAVVVATLLARCLGSGAPGTSDGAQERTMAASVGTGEDDAWEKDKNRAADEDEDRAVGEDEDRAADEATGKKTGSEKVKARDERKDSDAAMPELELTESNNADGRSATGKGESTSAQGDGQNRSGNNASEGTIGDETAEMSEISNPPEKQTISPDESSSSSAKNTTNDRDKGSESKNGGDAPGDDKPSEKDGETGGAHVSGDDIVLPEIPA